jgi:hypothetical protein
VIVIGSTWWTGLWALLCVACGVVALIRPLDADDRLARTAHLAMALAMADMLAPFGGHVPPGAGAVGFALLACWFAAAAVRTRRLDGPGHLAIGSVAMAVMYLAAAAPSSEAAVGGHAAHGGAAHGSAAHGAVLGIGGAVGLLLAGYFVWHIWRLLAPPAPLGNAGPTTGALTRTPLDLRRAAHVGLDAAMAAMLLGVI